MKEKINVLIFPAGSENGLNIYDSLKYNLHFNVFGASGKVDHCELIYPIDRLYIDDLYITNDNFIPKFNKIIKKFSIDFIIPTHDTIATFLLENSNKINAKLICSAYETAKIAENKELTYEILKDMYFYPKVFLNSSEVTKYPVFLKPFIGAGGKGTFIAYNKQELDDIMKKKTNLLISEYLPGVEYTVDCFTNRYGELLFVGPRTRERITIGITFRSERAENNEEFEKIANEINSRFNLRGAWFFQVKEDEQGKLKFMEFSVRQSGTMAFYRQLGVNFAALALFDAMGYDVKIMFNDYKLTLDRSLKNSYKFDYDYDKLYIDYDDTLIVNGKINTTLMKVVYQSINANKKIVLLTKHPYVLEESFKKYRINKDIFDEIIVISPDRKKAEYIDKKRAVFIDNYFPERLSVKEICNIPVFDVDAVECLIDSSAL
ncbi:ATP-grasp domain protein [Clostridiales bacterium oral taxon 876 str. F0540]|nr:ATP-grasp domain protein [Clostridiales bacterium oral taxon 876 str. F0540]